MAQVATWKGLTTFLAMAQVATLCGGNTQLYIKGYEPKLQIINIHYEKEKEIMDLLQPLSSSIQKTVYYGQVSLDVSGLKSIPEDSVFLSILGPNLKIDRLDVGRKITHEGNSYPIMEEIISQMLNWEIIKSNTQIDINRDSSNDGYFIESKSKKEGIWDPLERDRYRYGKKELIDNGWIRWK